ncbi:phosphotransferase [Kineosporia succinea]|uniref:Aminoglycoside phosphotransferase (APT) family kinase protein n=1 Tax=Kineosporia succinea TaxID=84632 RepID=A0ABT9P5A6_9ACTN|nr:phosphotransferase [Kineosporia succinea]MDP9827370.1 aminoglycoside phosphotransferase (APT) family kinase protein [Kineosporia succinea]
MPSRSALALAAMASAAISGLEPMRTQTLDATADDVDTALIEDNLSRHWVVRAPRNDVAGMRLDAESQLVAQLRSWLPFGMPEAEGVAPLRNGGRAIVHRQLPGRPVRPLELLHRPALAASYGEAIAAIHDLPPRLVEEAGLPVYTAEEYRFRRLAELDRVAATGLTPVRLLTRWEHAVEEVGAWRFIPCVVHGDLAGDNVLADGEKVTGVMEWSETRVADPADDLAWVSIGATEPAMRPVLEAYTAARSEPVDVDLARRARLSGEFAIARWLLHGVHTDDAAIVDDAVQMLADLEAGVGDQPW